MVTLQASKTWSYLILVYCFNVQFQIQLCLLQKINTQELFLTAGFCPPPSTSEIWVLLWVGRFGRDNTSESAFEGGICRGVIDWKLVINLMSAELKKYGTERRCPT